MSGAFLSTLYSTSKLIYRRRDFPWMTAFGALVTSHGQFMPGGIFPAHVRRGDCPYEQSVLTLCLHHGKVTGLRLSN